MSSLTDFIKHTGNQFATIASDGIIAGDVSNFVDSGSYTLNALLSGSIYGGFSGNKITVIAAPTTTGKSFFALGAAKHFLEQNPTGIVILFESESAITKAMLTERNIDVNRFGVVPISTVQEFRTQSLKIIENYEKESPKDRLPLFFILDSLGMLSTIKEMTDSVEGSDTRDMTRAQLIKATFRVLTLRLGRANIPLIVTNHVYAAVGQGLYAGNVQSGGSGSQYASSMTLTLTKAKEKDEANEVIGAIITVTATKSRLTKENSKVKCLIRYDGGLDRYYGLLDLAEEAEIFKKVSTRYEMPDGSKVFGKAIHKNPSKYYTKDVLDQLDKFCQKKFMYGVMNHDEINENEVDDICEL